MEPLESRSEIRIGNDRILDPAVTLFSDLEIALVSTPQGVWDVYSTPRRGLSSSFPKATFLMWISPYFGLSLPRLAQNHMLLKVHLNLNCWCFINFVPLVALHPT